MPESTPRRTSIDSFLPQFAPPGEANGAASATLNGHGPSSPQSLLNGHAPANGFEFSNGHTASNGNGSSNGNGAPTALALLNGHGLSNGHAASHDHNGHEQSNGDDAAGNHDLQNGAGRLNGHGASNDVAAAEDEHLYLDDELAAGFEEIQTAVVDSLHGSDEAESTLAPSDPLTVALGGEGSAGGNGRFSGDLGSYRSEPISQAAETSADQLAALHQADELPPRTGEASDSFGAQPTNGEVAPQSEPLAPAARSDLEAHPAAGSLFMPYLVTEIPDLRRRGDRRRSWWRRLLG